MNARNSVLRLSLLVLAFAAAVQTSACSKNPADGVPAATVEAPRTQEAAPSGEGEAPAAEDPAAEAPAAEAPAATPETLAFSNEGSKIEFVGSKVTGSHDGGFNAFSGSITLNPADLSASAVEVTIQMASVFSDNERLTGHLQSDDFFAIETHPTARFVSAEIRPAEGEENATHHIFGDLTLRGETRRIGFPATITVSDDKVDARAEFAINRRDFNINYDGMANDLIRNEVVLRLHLEAARGGSAE